MTATPLFQYDASADVDAAPPLPDETDSQCSNPSQDALQAYLSQLYRRPLCSAEEERRLTRLAVAGNAEARQKLIEAHLRLVVAIAQKYQHRGMDLADLIEEGNLGLLHALEKFDPERGVRLATYATWWIREGIEQAIKNQSRMIRLPVHIIKTLSKCLRQQEALRQQDGGNGKAEVVAKALNMSVSEVNYLLSLNDGCISLDAPLSSHVSYTAMESVPADQMYAPDTILHDVKVRTYIQQCLNGLNERQRYVIIHRFGLDGHDEATLQEVAQTLGVTRERTHQIQTAALKVLRRTLEQALLNRAAFI